MSLDAPDSATAPPVSRRRMLRWLLGFSVVSTLAMVVTPVVSFLLARWLLGFSVVSTLAMVVTPVVSFLLPRSRRRGQRWQGAGRHDRGHPARSGQGRPGGQQAGDRA